MDTASAAGMLDAGFNRVPTSGDIIAAVRTDANILEALHQSNEGEIDASRLAQSRAADSLVMAFAKQMVDDHVTLDKSGELLADRLMIIPTLPNDDLKRLHEHNITALRTDTAGTMTAGPGVAFDRRYIAMQIEAHQMVIDLLDVSIQRTTNTELRNALRNDIRPKVAAHLSRAREVQRSIGG
jgi:putative membrane protein